MRAVRNQMTLDALAGQGHGLRDLLLNGLRVVDSLRRSSGVQAGVKSAPKRSRSTWVSLKYGAKAEILLEVGTPNEDGTKKLQILVKIYNRNGVPTSTADPLIAVRLLLDRINNEPQLAIKVASGIERARKQALRFFEESTRWL